MRKAYKISPFGKFAVTIIEIKIVHPCDFFYARAQLGIYNTYLLYDFRLATKN